MKLLESTKSKISKDKNDENVPHLEVTKVMLVRCNILNNDYQQDLRDLYAIFREFTPKFYILKNVWFRILIYWSIVYWSKF